MRAALTIRLRKLIKHWKRWQRLAKVRLEVRQNGTSSQSKTRGASSGRTCSSKTGADMTLRQKNLAVLTIDRTIARDGQVRRGP
jgi:hypothetical protein